MPAGPPDAARFAALFRLHYRDIDSFARRRVGEDAAQEVVAATFLVAWRRLADVPDPPLPWLYQVARYEVAALTRTVTREGRLRLVLSHSLSAQQDDRGVDLGYEVTRVGRAFSQLTASEQEVLRLAAWEELSSMDGAQVLGCTVAAYRVRLHRATDDVSCRRFWRCLRRRRPITADSADPSPAAINQFNGGSLILTNGSGGP
jgi:RNA polymerase sigma factor (sigma-70 family)